MSELNKTRIDKWLWATRWFKTRTQATDACNSGKVKVENQNVKPAYQIQPGQTIVFQKSGIKNTVVVQKIIEKRVGAPLAQKCFTDMTPPEEKEKLSSAFRINYEMRDKGIGRPTKKDRREIERFKNNEDED